MQQSGIFFEIIEIDQMPAGVIHHEIEHLFEKIGNINTFLVFPQRAEKEIQQRKNLNAMQVSHKKCQTGPPCQLLAGWLYVADFKCVFAINFVILCHTVLHLLGYALWLLFLCHYCYNISKIVDGGELFLTKNRLA